MHEEYKQTCECGTTTSLVSNFCPSCGVPLSDGADGIDTSDSGHDAVPLRVLYESSKPSEIEYHHPTFGLMKFDVEGSKAILNDDWDRLGDGKLIDGFTRWVTTGDVLRSVQHLPFIEWVELSEDSNEFDRCWDREDCPREDCDGELEQQDQYNVMCLRCEDVFTHGKTETKHYLQTPSCEIVAEKPIAMTDGGVGQSTGDTKPYEAFSSLFNRWAVKADENISEWGAQGERTLLLAMQEELGELTQAFLEAESEDGDPMRIWKELDDLGALLVQFHAAHNARAVWTNTDRSEDVDRGEGTETDGGVDRSTDGVDRTAIVPDPRDELSQIVAGVLSDRYPDPIYTVEDGTVWVSGMNSHAPQIARQLAKELVHSENIPCSLVRDDNAAAFGGVEFDYYNPELLDTADSSTTETDHAEEIVTDGGVDQSTSGSEQSSFISHPNTGTLHRGSRASGATCGQPSESWVIVDAENPLDAVYRYGTEPCSKCFNHTSALHRVVLKRHSSHHIRKDLSEITARLPWSLPADTDQHEEIVTDGGVDQSAGDTEQQRVEESVSDTLREDLKEQEPSEAEKQALREEHEGHLVRDTTSKLAVEFPDVGRGMEVRAKAEIPDTYCFSCEEWIGLSGVNLRGTPRSRSEAYYLGGMPMDVLHAKNGTEKTLNELANRLTDRIDTLEDRSDALQFIETELEQLRSVDTDTGRSEDVDRGEGTKTDGGVSSNDTAHLDMIYAEFVDSAMRSEDPVTEIREVGDYRRIYSAAMYDPDTEVVWRADIDVDHNPDFETTPSVKFGKCYPTSDARIMQKWTSLAAGRLSGPQALEPWQSLFTVFNAALEFYEQEAPQHGSEDGGSV